jgi:peptidase E
MIGCDSCGERFAVLPVGLDTLGFAESLIDYLDIEDVDLGDKTVQFLPWAESLNDFAAFMSQTEDFLGLEDMDVDNEEESIADGDSALAAKGQPHMSGLQA